METETILIVEDNDDLRQGLCDMLAYEGFHAIGARNGLDALDTMKGVHPEIIISDISMPIMDGFAFFQEVRNREEWVTIPFIFLTARVDPVDVIYGKNLGVDDYLTKPISRDELVTSIQARLNRMRQVQSAQLQRAYQSSLTVMANAIDQRDPLVHGHVERVMDYALVIAQHLGWSDQQLEILRFGAILHDIGKIHIPEKTLFKTTPLTQQDWEFLQRHPVTGAEMLRDIPHLSSAIPYVRHHHENWDGSGYPDGLAGENIPEGARILALCDAFDAMTTPHRYGEQRSFEEALQEIQDLSGIRYDPRLVSVFFTAWELGQIEAIAANH